MNGLSNAKRYKVTVVAETVEKRVVENENWVTLEVTGDGSDRHEKRGYAPPVEKVVSERVTIFEQTVETLDMSALVLTVNGIAKP